MPRSDLAVVFGGIMMVPFAVQLASLHPASARRMRVARITSILITGGLLAFFLVRYPAVAWIAPGYYLSLVLDLFFARRAHQIAGIDARMSAPSPAPRHVVTYAL